MASNERKIHPAFSPPSCSLPQSIYTPPPPPPTLPTTTPPPTPLRPSTTPFLIRQILRELGAISAAGTGVMCVSVCLCDLGACVCVPDCVLCVLKQLSGRQGGGVG